MQTALEDTSDPFLALLAWRNTPSEQLGQSPSQIMFARRTRAHLSTTDRPTHGKRLQYISTWFTLISERASGILLQPRGPRETTTRGRRCGEDEVEKRGGVEQGYSRGRAPPPFVSISMWRRNYSPSNFSSCSVFERTPSLSETKLLTHQGPLPERN